MTFHPQNTSKRAGTDLIQQLKVEFLDRYRTLPKVSQDKAADVFGVSRGCLRNLLRDESVSSLVNDTVIDCEVVEVGDDETAVAETPSNSRRFGTAHWSWTPRIQHAGVRKTYAQTSFKITSRTFLSNKLGGIHHVPLSYGPLWLVSPNFQSQGGLIKRRPL